MSTIDAIIDKGYSMSKQIGLVFSSSTVYRNTEDIINNCNDKKIISFNDYQITHLHRKYFVFGITAGSMLLLKTIKLRHGFSLFVFYSLLFCRENLNPYSM